VLMCALSLMLSVYPLLLSRCKFNKPIHHQKFGRPTIRGEVWISHLATNGFQILAVTLTNDKSRMKHVRARLPLVSQTVKFPRHPSHSS
jgi:hypothetical protein